jgi:hypothetical protein
MKIDMEYLTQLSIDNDPEYMYSLIGKVVLGIIQDQKEMYDDNIFNTISTGIQFLPINLKTIQEMIHPSCNIPASERIDFSNITEYDSTVKEVNGELKTMHTFYFKNISSFYSLFKDHKILLGVCDIVLSKQHVKITKGESVIRIRFMFEEENKETDEILKLYKLGKYKDTGEAIQIW